MICRQLNRQRRAATVVEAAVVLSALLLLMLAIFDYGRYIMIRQIVDNAAREGCRLAISANDADTNSFNYQTAATIQNTVLSYLAGQDTALTGLTVQVFDADATGNNIGSWTNATFGNNIAVSVSGTYTPMLPGMTLPIAHINIGYFPANVTVSSTCIMHTEAN